MSIVWTKEFSSSDDGSILTGGQLGDIQSDITNNTVHLTGDQTIYGEKTFVNDITINGILILSGSVNSVIKDTDYVFYENDLCGYENDVVYYSS